MVDVDLHRLAEALAVPPDRSVKTDDLGSFPGTEVLLENLGIALELVSCRPELSIFVELVAAEILTAEQPMPEVVQGQFGSAAVPSQPVAARSLAFSVPIGRNTLDGWIVRNKPVWGLMRGVFGLRTAVLLICVWTWIVVR
jgi:hypothetical protein